MHTSQKGIDLIKNCEGLRLTAYQCSAGKWTIGYGHTEGVKEGDKITEKQAECFLRSDLVKFEHDINQLVQVPLTQGEFDALVSFSYNCGPSALSTSTLLSKLNAGDYGGAADEFLKWDKVKGMPLAGLMHRRMLEQHLFLGEETQI